MSVLLEFSMSPMDKGASVGQHVAGSLDIIDRSGIAYRLNPMGTVLEGEWDECFDVVQSCFRKMATDCHRITCTIKVDYRRDGEGRLDAKTESVQQRLGRSLRQ